MNKKNPYVNALLLLDSFFLFSSITMSKRQKLTDAAYRKLKATREREERTCAASLKVFLQKKYLTKVKCKDEDAECTSKLGWEKNQENANMEETNTERRFEEEFSARINVVKDAK